MFAVVNLLSMLSFSTLLAGNSAAYRWNENNNRHGANRCTWDKECDGARTCSQYGWCQGEARPAKSTRYWHDEGGNQNGSSTCSWDYDCDGLRKCSQWGWCEGQAR